MEADPKSSGFSLDTDAAILSMENIGIFHLWSLAVSGGISMSSCHDLEKI